MPERFECTTLAKKALYKCSSFPFPFPFSQKEAEPPIFGPCLLWPNGWMDQDGTWPGGRPWCSPHCARWGHSSPLQKSWQSPQVSAHLYCGQTAGCITMPLCMQVSLSPGDFVLDRDPAPTPKGAEPHPIFGPRLLWPNGCMHQDATWYGGRLRPTRHCVRCGPRYPQKKGPIHLTLLLPMSIAAKWLDE